MKRKELHSSKRCFLFNRLITRYIGEYIYWLIFIYIFIQVFAYYSLHKLVSFFHVENWLCYGSTSLCPHELIQFLIFQYANVLLVWGDLPITWLNFSFFLIILYFITVKLWILIFSILNFVNSNSFQFHFICLFISIIFIVIFYLFKIQIFFWCEFYVPAMLLQNSWLSF